MHTVEHGRLASKSIVENRLQHIRAWEKVVPFKGLNIELKIGLDSLLIVARPSPSSSCVYSSRSRRQRKRLLVTSPFSCDPKRNTSGHEHVYVNGRQSRLGVREEEGLAICLLQHVPLPCTTPHILGANSLKYKEAKCWRVVDGTRRFLVCGE
jgi:hypothetical protein